jgi:hypothetical protein
VVVTALGLIASGVFLLRLLPQPVRLARSGVAAGVSPVSALNAVTCATAWTIYGLAQGDPVIWLVSMVAFFPGLWQAALLRRSIQARDVAVAGAVAALIAGAAAAGGLGTVLAGSVVLTAGPQLRMALTADDLSGIAPATWRVALVDAATWGTYGWAVGDAALIGYAVVLTSASTVILGRLAASSRAPASAAAEAELAFS